MEDDDEVIALRPFGIALRRFSIGVERKLDVGAAFLVGVSDNCGCCCFFINLLFVFFFSGGDWECSAEDDREREILLLAGDDGDVVFVDDTTCFCVGGGQGDGDVEEKSLGVAAGIVGCFRVCCCRVPNFVTS